MSEITVKPRAAQDLIEIATDLYNAEPFTDLSERFLTAAEQAFAQLAAMPGMGTAYSSPLGSSAGLHRWPVPGFRNYLIFYRPLASGVDIIRVLHGSRSIAAALGEDGNDTE